MSKNFPFDLWISTGSDSGISFATVGRLAKDSSMMQGILLSLQSLMTTEVEVSNSQFMTGENEFVKFGTFTISEESDTVVVQYVVKSDEANKLSKENEMLVQELALSFCKFITLTPNFHRNLATGKMISLDYVSKAYLKACTIAKQKVAVSKNNDALINLIKAKLKLIENKPADFPTVLQLKDIKQWIGEEETSWDKGSISPFKRQLLVQMVAQDILNQIILEDPFVILEYETPRYTVEEIRNTIELYLREKQFKPEELIDLYLAKNLQENVDVHLKKLNISEIHTAKTFIANNLAKEIIYKIAKDNPLHTLTDFRNIPLYTAIQSQITTLTDVPDPGSIICNGLIEDVTPLVLQGARLFFKQLIDPFAGRKLPTSIWNVIIDFTFSILDEKKIVQKSTTKKTAKTSIEFKRGIVKDRLSKLTNIHPEWIKQLIDKFNTMGVGKQLQISNIEESVLFASALERAIITTLEKMVKDQLFNFNLGDIFTYMINAFREIAPKTVLVNILSKVIVDVKYRGYETAKQMSLTAKDLIGAAIDEGEIKAYVNSVPVQNKRPFFRESYLRFDGRTISSNELLQKQGVTVSLGNKIFPLRDVEKDAEFLTTCFTNSKTLKKAYAKAILRGMVSSYLQKMFTFEGKVINLIDTLITVFNREMVGKLTPAHRLPDIQNGFPSFPQIRDIPQKFAGKHFHVRCQESWNDYAPKIHKTIQDLLTGFSNLRKNDLSYKKKAMRLYNKAGKELKDIRKNLLKNWNPLNDQMTKVVEKWSKDVSIDLSGHLNEVSRNVTNWTGDIFKLQRLEYGKFTISLKRAQKEILNTINEIHPKEFRDLPKNFMEIALSILLYRRIPDYVIDESYNQMISGEKRVADAVLRAWGKSKSRSEFENNLYLNMRALGNTFTEIINTYGRLTSTFFIKNDIELSSDKNGHFITLGLIPKEIYETKTEVLSMLTFPNVEAVSSGKDWEIRLFLEPEYRRAMDENRERLIVMSDIIRFVARMKFEENTGPVIEGLKSVIPYLIENGDTNIIDLSETLKEALFRLSEYPTQVIEEKVKK